MGRPFWPPFGDLYARLGLLVAACVSPWASFGRPWVSILPPFCSPRDFIKIVHGSFPVVHGVFASELHFSSILDASWRVPGAAQARLGHQDEPSWQPDSEWFEMVRNGSEWFGMVWNGFERFQNGPQTMKNQWKQQVKISEHR